MPGKIEKESVMAIELKDLMSREENYLQWYNNPGNAQKQKEPPALYAKIILPFDHSNIKQEALFRHFLVDCIPHFCLSQEVILKS